MKRTRILVVEDNAPSLTLAEHVLLHSGYEVMTASDVDEACMHIVDGSVGLVLTDVQLPGGGGTAVLRAIRNQPEISGIPVIAVTALAMLEDRQRLIELGFDGYISKPIDIRTFVEQVESYLP